MAIDLVSEDKRDTVTLSAEQYDALTTDLSTLSTLALQISMKVSPQWVGMADRVKGIVEHAQATLGEATV